MRKKKLPGIVMADVLHKAWSDRLPTAFTKCCYRWSKLLAQHHILNDGTAATLSAYPMTGKRVNEQYRLMQFQFLTI